MKDDLISRSALLEKATNVTKYDEGGWDMDLRAVPVEDIENAPAVDAETVIKSLPYVKEALEMAKQSLAPVVRCKDCEHKRERNEHEQNYLTEGVLICTSQYASNECWNPVWPDHFCSYGERRADDATD